MSSEDLKKSFQDAKERVNIITMRRYEIEKVYEAELKKGKLTAQRKTDLIQKDKRFILNLNHARELLNRLYKKIHGKELSFRPLIPVERMMKNVKPKATTLKKPATPSTSKKPATPSSSKKPVPKTGEKKLRRKPTLKAPFSEDDKKLSLEQIHKKIGDASSERVKIMNEFNALSVTQQHQRFNEFQIKEHNIEREKNKYIFMVNEKAAQQQGKYFIKYKAWKPKPIQSFIKKPSPIPPKNPSVTTTTTIRKAAPKPPVTKKPAPKTIQPQETGMKSAVGTFDTGKPRPRIRTTQTTQTTQTGHGKDPITPTPVITAKKPTKQIDTTKPLNVKPFTDKEKEGIKFLRKEIREMDKQIFLKREEYGHYEVGGRRSYRIDRKGAEIIRGRYEKIFNKISEYQKEIKKLYTEKGTPVFPLEARFVYPRTVGEFITKGKTVLTPNYPKPPPQKEPPKTTSISDPSEDEISVDTLEKAEDEFMEEEPVTSEKETQTVAKQVAKPVEKEASGPTLKEVEKTVEEEIVADVVIPETSKEQTTETSTEEETVKEPITLKAPIVTQRQTQNPPDDDPDSDDETDDDEFEPVDDGEDDEDEGIDYVPDIDVGGLDFTGRVNAPLREPPTARQPADSGKVPHHYEGDFIPRKGPGLPKIYPQRMD